MDLLSQEIKFIFLLIILTCCLIISTVLMNWPTCTCYIPKINTIVLCKICFDSKPINAIFMLIFLNLLPYYVTKDNLPLFSLKNAHLNQMLNFELVYLSFVLSFEVCKAVLFSTFNIFSFKYIYPSNYLHPLHYLKSQLISYS